MMASRLRINMSIPVGTVVAEEVRCRVLEGVTAGAAADFLVFLLKCDFLGCGGGVFAVSLALALFSWAVNLVGVPPPELARRLYIINADLGS